MRTALGPAPTGRGAANLVVRRSQTLGFGCLWHGGPPLCPTAQPGAAGPHLLSGLGAMEHQGEANPRSRTQSYAKVESRPGMVEPSGGGMSIRSKEGRASMRVDWPGSCCEVRGRSLYWDRGPGLKRKGRYAHPSTSHGTAPTGGP